MLGYAGIGARCVPAWCRWWWWSADVAGGRGVAPARARGKENHKAVTDAIQVAPARARGKGGGGINAPAKC